MTLVEKAYQIVDLAKKRGITLRLLGALAIRIHCQSFCFLHDRTGRVLTDIDLIGLSKQWGKIVELLKELGYKLDKRILFKQADRIVADSPDEGVHVDVFFDKLEMCHTIDLRKRLHLDYPTLTVSDLLLEKIQIVKITEKDLIDLTMLIREHPIGHDDNDKINSKYISKILSNDWGFYYTSINNLRKLQKYVEDSTFLSSEDKKDVISKISQLINAIEYEPKSLGWKMRAKLGTKVKWYREVEDLYR